MARSRITSIACAIVIAFAMLIGFGQLGCKGFYAGQGAYRAQVDAFLHGRLALTEAPEGLAHDLALTPSGVHQVWGLGGPLWQTPFELVARAIGQGPFPDRISLGLWIALMLFMLLRAFRRRDDEPWWIGAGSVGITALLPGFVTMLRGRLGAYEEAAIYAYGAAMILLAGLVIFERGPTRTRYLLLLFAAGLTGLIRPTVWFYGLATAIVASLIYLKVHGRRAVSLVAIGALVFGIGGATLYATNTARFGAGSEFGHTLNIASLPGNIVATRFSYPFERVGTVEAAVELVGGLFDRPERNATREFYTKDLHVGQSDTVRWREYYFTTYSWAYLPLLLGGLVLGAMSLRRIKRDDAGSTPWLLVWAVLGGLPLFVFYLHSPSVSSRYQLDLGPAVAAILVIAWRAAAAWSQKRSRPWIAFAILCALWATALVTSKARGHVKADPTTRGTATRSAWALSRPTPEARTMPASYALTSTEWIATEKQPRPHGLYLNAIGWDAATGRVPPATHFYVEDPRYIVLEVDVDGPMGGEVDWAAWVRVTTGRHPLKLVKVEPAERGWRLRYEPTTPFAPGLQVVFVAFGPDTQLDREVAPVLLRSIRWRD